MKQAKPKDGLYVDRVKDTFYVKDSKYRWCTTHRGEDRICGDISGSSSGGGMPWDFHEDLEGPVELYLPEEYLT